MTPKKSPKSVREISEIHFSDVFRKALSRHAMSVSRSSTMSSHSNSLLSRRCRLMVHVRPVEDKFTVVSLFSTSREFGYPVEFGEISSNKPYMGRLRWGLGLTLTTSKKPLGTCPYGFKTCSMLLTCSTSVAELVVADSEPTATSAHRVDEALAIIIASGWSAVK